MTLFEDLAVRKITVELNFNLDTLFGIYNFFNVDTLLHVPYLHLILYSYFDNMSL